MKKLLFLLFFMFVSTNVLAGDNDVLVTRDGTFTPVKIIRIGTQDITYLDLSKKKRQRTIPTTSVYMIIKEKRNNIFFNEEGTQMTSSVVNFDKRDNVMFTNDGNVFPIYEVSIVKDAVTFKRQDKKKAPTETINKSDIFMIRNSDGTSTVFTTPVVKQETKSSPVVNNSFQQATKESTANMPIAQNASITDNTTVASTGMTQDLLTKNAQTIAAFNARKIPYDGKDEGKELKFSNGGYFVYKYAFTPNSILENVDLSVRYYIVDYYTSSNGGTKIVDIKETTDKRKPKGWWSGIQGLGLSLTNKTNRIIYIDLGQTFLAQAGISQPYFVPSATSVSKGTSNGASVNMGAVSGVLGVSGALGTLANGVNVGGGKTTETTHVTYSQRVVAVPPRSTINLDPQRLTDEYQHQINLFSMQYLYNDKQRDFKSWNMVGRTPIVYFGECFDLPVDKSPILSSFITYGYEENLQKTSNLMADLYISQLFIANSGFDTYAMPLYYSRTAGFSKAFVKEVIGE
ncbi:MAG: hypothetical protein IKX24_06975 [Prevotella sp.]|nr:hypothetical protein [Prevotella sp.]